MPATNELLQEGRYRISQASTHTGEEKTFEAYDTVRNTNVIVREIPVKLNAVATVSQRESLKLAFANQAKALKEIEHDSIPHIHDYFSEIDRQYLVLEAVEGDDLSQLLSKRNKPFSVADVTRWADELLDALNYLHTRKPAIIHRNINPSNVKLHPSGKIKLQGVGVETGSDSEFASSVVDDDDLRYSPMEQIWPGLDPASQKVITNSYDDRSERILKQPLDERSDIYSLGATLYFLITGVEPVDAIERSIEILEGKLDPLQEPTKVDAQIPAEISDVLMKALEIKRENRYDSALIMRQVLKTALARVAESDDQQATAATPYRSEEAKTGPSDAEAAEQRRLAAEAEAQRNAEAMQRQLREAEEQRVRAQQAAEAGRLVREKSEAQHAAEAEAAKVRVPEEDLLEIPVAADVVAYKDNSAEDELAAVLRELEEADAEAGGGVSSKPIESIADAGDVITFDSPLDLDAKASESRPSLASEEADGDIFTVPERVGSSLPIPAIAGAICLVVVLAIGGWFVMSGSSEAPKPQPVAPVQAALPAPVESNPSPETIASSSEPQAESNSAVVGTPFEQAAVTSRTAPTPKPKKVESAKADTAKKKVTVDDLINDN